MDDHLRYLLWRLILAVHPPNGRSRRRTRHVPATSRAWWPTMDYGDLATITLVGRILTIGLAISIVAMGVGALMLVVDLVRAGGGAHVRDALMMLGGGALGVGLVYLASFLFVRFGLQLLM